MVSAVKNPLYNLVLRYENKWCKRDSLKKKDDKLKMKS